MSILCYEKPSHSCNIPQESAFCIPFAFLFSIQLTSSTFLGLINIRFLSQYVSKLFVNSIAFNIICGTLSWFFVSPSLSSKFCQGHLRYSTEKAQNNFKNT